MKIAVIPARGGSKRIPRKNIRPFAGRPIIEYSIEAALTARMFDRIVVSTDDDEIAQVARNAGADVPFLRPAAIADDYTGTNVVVRHALEQMATLGSRFEYACCIYPTAPFLESVRLHEGYDRLRRSGKSFAFSVTTYPFPIQRAIRLDRTGAVEPVFREYATARSQDLEDTYHDAGQFYWGTASAFLEDVPLFSNAAVPVVLPRHLVQDIDTIEDWCRAELMYRAWQLSGGAGQ